MIQRIANDAVPAREQQAKLLAKLQSSVVAAFFARALHLPERQKPRRGFGTFWRYWRDSDGQKLKRRQRRQVDAVVARVRAANRSRPQHRKLPTNIKKVRRAMKATGQLEAAQG